MAAAEEVMNAGALSRPMEGFSNTKKEAEEAAAISEAMKTKAEEAAAVSEAMKKKAEVVAAFSEAVKKRAEEVAAFAEAMEKTGEEAMKKSYKAALVAKAMKKKAGEAAAVAEAMKKELEEAMKKTELAAAIGEAMQKKAGEVADIAVAEHSASSLAEATKKMEDVAAVTETVIPADAVLPSDGEDAGDLSDEDDLPSVKVHDQKTVDYILSWTYAERNPFKNRYDDEDEDYEGFVTAEEKEICAYFAEQVEGLIEFQQKVRDEYEETGYVTVPDDYEERYARLQAAVRNQGMDQDA